MGQRFLLEPSGPDFCPQKASTKMQTKLQTHAPELAQFSELTIEAAGRFLVRAAAAMARKPNATPPELLGRTVMAAAALLDRRGQRGEALDYAEATAAQVLAQAPQAWHLASRLEGGRA